MRKLQKFGKRIDLPSTAQIIHELKMLMALDAVRAAMQALPPDDRSRQIAALEALLAEPDTHSEPTPAKGMEMLRRGSREQELRRLLSDEAAVA